MGPADSYVLPDDRLIIRNPGTYVALNKHDEYAWQFTSIYYLCCSSPQTQPGDQTPPGCGLLTGVRGYRGSSQDVALRNVTIWLKVTVSVPHDPPPEPCF